MHTRDQLLALARTQPGALVDLVLELEAQLQALQARLAQNSQNSHRPPASDGYRKPPPKSQRQRTGRRPGGQVGHPGCTLQPVTQPDHFQVHPATDCTNPACPPGILKDQPVLGYESRQVFDLPPRRLEVTEHRAEVKTCPCCARQVTAPFPSHVTAPVQYGPQFLGLMVYLHHRQLLPYGRLSQLAQDIFGQPVSPATLQAADHRAYHNLAGFESRLVQLLQQVPVLNVDETGLRVAGKLHWLHVACTPKLTFYGVHPKRGSEATDQFNILPQRDNWLIHDFWKPYLHYETPHGSCNGHILRELTAAHTIFQQPWAGQMHALLQDLHQQTRGQTELTDAQIEAGHQRYLDILDSARKLHPRCAPAAGSGRRPKQTFVQNLLDRLQDYEYCVLAFLHDPQVPFTNNQAEQDLRMVKVKEKISGCFRTLHGAQVFARIQSYFSTMRKQGHDLLEAITRALLGHPIMPSAP